MRGYVDTWWNERIKSVDWWIEDVIISGLADVVVFSVIARILYGVWWWNL